MGMGKKTEVQPATRDYTINLHKNLQGIQFKKRAPRAIRNIKRFAMGEMYVKDVRVETNLNRFIWSSGIRNVPRKVRIRVSRLRSEDEDAKEKFYCIVKHLPVRSFQGLL